MTTKPEGPAQKPQCKRCNGTGVVRPAADDCARCGGTGIEPVPATPAPSQPAGWLSAIREVLTSDKSDAAKLIAVGILASSSEPLTEAEIKRGQQIWNERNAPSQPAGAPLAEEWWSSLRGTRGYIGEADKWWFQVMNEYGQFVAAQQTAAKDAEWLKAYHILEDRAHFQKNRADAAERERDSLRELLKRLNRRGGLGLDVHEEIDAALKSGKDGQQ